MRTHNGQVYPLLINPSENQKRGGPGKLCPEKYLNRFNTNWFGIWTRTPRAKCPDVESLTESCSLTEDPETVGCINAALLLSQAPQNAGSSLQTFDPRRGSVHSFFLLKILPRKVPDRPSHFTLEANVGSVHGKTGPGKLLETQLGHSIVGRLVYSFSDAAWRALDFCANAADSALPPATLSTSSLVPSVVKWIASRHTHTAVQKTCFTYYQLLLWSSWELHQTKMLLVTCVSCFPNSSLI